MINNGRLPLIGLSGSCDHDFFQLIQFFHLSGFSYAEVKAQARFNSDVMVMSRVAEPRGRSRKIGGPAPRPGVAAGVDQNHKDILYFPLCFKTNNSLT